MKKMIMGFLLSIAVVSCGTNSKTNTNENKEVVITNTQWKLADNVKGNSPTLNIEEGKISGNAGCNNYFGTLITDPNTGSFTTSGIGSTRKACEDMSAENNFLSMLPKANKYKVSGNSLELYQDKLLLLKFDKMQ